MTPGPINYDTTIGRVMESDIFLNKTPEERGGFLTAVQKGYVTKYRDYLSEDDVSKIGAITEERLSDFKHKYNQPRYVPSQEELQNLAVRIPSFSPDQSLGDRSFVLDEWANKNIEIFSADNYRSAEKGDIEVFFRSYANDLIRKEAFRINQTGAFGDLWHRFWEGLFRPVHSAIDPSGAARFWAEVAPELPSKDGYLTSKIVGKSGLVLVACLLVLLCIRGFRRKSKGKQVQAKTVEA